MTDRDGVFTVQRGDQELEIKTRPKVTKPGLPPNANALGYGRPVAHVVGELVKPGHVTLRTRHTGTLRLHVTTGHAGRRGRAPRDPATTRSCTDGPVETRIPDMLEGWRSLGVGAPIVLRTLTLTP